MQLCVCRVRQERCARAESAKIDQTSLRHVAGVGRLESQAGGGAAADAAPVPPRSSRSTSSSEVWRMSLPCTM